MKNNILKLALVLTVLAVNSNFSFSSDSEEEGEVRPLVGPLMMRHVKSISEETGKPATLRISLSQSGDSYHLDLPVKLVLGEMPDSITTDYLKSLISREATLNTYIQELQSYGALEADVKINLFFEGDLDHPLNVCNYGTIPIQ